MCLVTFQNKPFVAEKDIVCYKRVVINKYSNFVSPVIKRKIPDAVMSGKRLYRARGLFRHAYIHPAFPWVSIVDKGWIHTYANEPYFFENKNMVWFECVIPNGTKYWKSEDGHEYASSYIRFVKPCEEQIRAFYADCIGGSRCPTEYELSDIVGSLERTKRFFKNLAY